MKSKAFKRAHRDEEAVARRGDARDDTVASHSPEEQAPGPDESRVNEFSDAETDAFLEATAAGDIGRSARLGQAVQTRLEVSDPHDELEREADRVAEEVMSAPEGEVPAQISAESSSGGSEFSPTRAGAAEAISGGGTPLPENVRGHFETTMGVDLGGVRVHAGPEAAEAAKSLKAQAFTVGSDVAFGAGKWAPETPDGERLLAHELVHVAQQAEPSNRLFRSESQGDPGTAAEVVADLLTEKGESIHEFSRFEEDDGIFMNSEYWEVVYYYENEKGEKLHFTGTRSATAFEQYNSFIQLPGNFDKWGGLHPVVVIVRPKGSPSKAIQDFTDKDSADKYSYECFTATALFEFAAMYYSYNGKDADFDKEYKDYVIFNWSTGPKVHFRGTKGEAAMKFPGEKEAQVGTLADIAEGKTSTPLKKGDWLTLDNRKYAKDPTDPWQIQNAVYLGEKGLYCHNLGSLTPEQYANKLRLEYADALMSSASTVMKNVKVELEARHIV